MARYYCPYCSFERQVILDHDRRNENCVICGEELKRVYLVKPSQVISLIVVFSFICPLGIFVFSSIKLQLENRMDSEEKDLALNLKIKQ